jgi:hypothetical protein
VCLLFRAGWEVARIAREEPEFARALRVPPRKIKGGGIGTGIRNG